MTKTENYELNQWEPSDRVLREDFNADNAKIDAALSGMPVKQLLSQTLDSAADHIDLDLTGFDLSRCKKLEVHFSGQLDSYGAAFVRLNSLSGDYFHHSTGSTQKSQTNLLDFTMTENPGGGRIVLYFLGEQILATACCASWDSNTIYFSDGSAGIRSSVLSSADLHTINFLATTGKYFQPGTTVTLLEFLA